MEGSEGKACTRRSFLKGAGVLGGVAAMGLAGCAPKSAQEDQASSSVDASQASWNEETDFVIVGCGIAGASAAVTVATEGNGATCMVLEKSDSECGGGNTIFSEGNVLYTDDAEAFLTYMKGLRAGFDATPDDVLEAWSQGCAENLSWVLSLGADEGEMYIQKPGEVNRYQSVCYPENPELDGSESVAQFNWLSDSETAHVQKFLVNVCKQHVDVVDIVTGAEVYDLVKDSATGRIAGVAYRRSSGKEVYVKARKGVVMCCGGFENNREMIQDYMHSSTAVAPAGLHNTGDGFRMCQKIGASFWHMSQFTAYWNNIRTLDDTTQGKFQVLKKNLGITVGKNGRRYYMDWDGGVVGETFQKGSDISLNYNSRHGKENFGGEYATLPLPSESWLVFDQAALEAGIMADNGDDPVGDGFGYSADTIEDLASQMGVPVDELVKTVDLWNSYCENGEDLSFHRPASSLTPVATAPFYGLRCVPEFLNTDGGPRRNAYGQILDVDKNPIPGLYGAGEFGAVWCNMYQGAGELADGMVYGRIAVRHALGA